MILFYVRTEIVAYYYYILGVYYNVPKSTLGNRRRLHENRRRRGGILIQNLYTYIFLHINRVKVTDVIGCFARARRLKN